MPSTGEKDEELIVKPIKHGSFSIERTYPATPARVFAAWTDIETKARWFMGPAGKWQLTKRELELRVGGRELLHGQFHGGPRTRFEARYHDIVPSERLVYAYDVYVDDEFHSVSLATMELSPASGGGTRMLFTEQAAFLDGEDGCASRQEGTAAHLDRLGSVLAEPAEIVSARCFSASPVQLFGAVIDPAQLTRWWGPRGFTSTFHEFDPRPGGSWRFTFHAPDGAQYPNRNDFMELVPNERIVLQHVQEQHDSTLTMTFRELSPGQTLLTWRLRFASEEEARRIRPFVEEGNEQNFERLAAHLGSGPDTAGVSQ